MVVLIIFPLILQRDINVIMLFIEGQGAKQHCSEWSVWHVTVLDPHSLVSYRPLTTMLVWNVFFCLSKYSFAIIVIYITYISQGSVEMHILSGGIYNNHIIANCTQSAPVKKFWKSVNNWWRYKQKQKGTFFTNSPCMWNCWISTN